MVAELLSFFRPAMSVRGDWSSQEIAEFYRVEAALVQAGVSVFVDRGLSDEGDPWFVFCRAADGEVIVHFARVDGNYLIVADSIASPIRGPNFRTVLADFAAVNPALIPIPRSHSAKLMLHPASLLAAIVATALYHMSGTEAVASTLDPDAVDFAHSQSHGSSSFGAETISDPARKWSDWQIAAVVSAMIALAATEYSDQAREMLFDLASNILDTSHDHIVLPHSVIAETAPPAELDGKEWTAGLLDSREASVLFDNVILSGGGEAANQPFQVGSTDASPTSLTTSPVPAPDSAGGEHWWTVLTHSSEADPRYVAWTETTTGLSGDASSRAADQLALATPPPANGGISTSGTDSSHPNLTAGSSSPDHSAGVPEGSNSQSAIVLVNNELSAESKAAPLINLSGSLSVQDVITHGVNDVLGTNAPNFSVASSHDGGQLSPVASLTPNGSASSGNSAGLGTVSVSQTSSQPQQATNYQPFNAAANEVLDAFVSKNNFEVLTSNNNVVLFDTNAADFSSPDLVTRTWSLSDGSTISIVGILPHSLAAVA